MNEMHLTLADRLRYLMREERLKQKDLAEMLETSPQTVNNWLKRNSMSRDSAQSISESMGYSLDWLLNGTGQPKLEGLNFIGSRLKIAEWSNELRDSSDFVEVPLLSVTMPTGGGADQVYDNDLHVLPFRADTLKRLGIRVADARVVTVIGDSMEPKLSDGDKVAINLNDRTIRDGKMYAIRMGEIQRIKTLISRPDGGIIVRSYNQAYEDELITKDQLAKEDMVVIGRVWWISSLI